MLDIKQVFPLFKGMLKNLFLYCLKNETTIFIACRKSADAVTLVNHL